MKSVSVFAVVLIALSGCADSNSESEVNTAATAVEFNLAGSPTVQFEVPDMMCEESCAKAVKETLAAQPGVEEVVVDFPNRRATVAVDKKMFDADAALAALLDKQFTEAKLVK